LQPCMAQAKCPQHISETDEGMQGSELHGCQAPFYHPKHGNMRVARHSERGNISGMLISVKVGHLPRSEVDERPPHKTFQFHRFPCP